MTPYWRDRAACKSRPTDWWFTAPDTPEFERAAAICGRCPVIEECSLSGFQRSEWGLWGTHLQAEGNKWRRKRVLVRCERCGTPVVGEHGELLRCSGCVRVRGRKIRLATAHGMLEGMDIEDAQAAFEAFLHDSGRRSA